MKVDTAYLKRHYASLSDEGLLEIDRDQLVDEARKCLDDEIAQRNLDQDREIDAYPDDLDPVEPMKPGEPSSTGSTNEDAKPDWLDDGAEVLSRVDRAGMEVAGGLLDARIALESAGIPCYLSFEERPEETRIDPPSRIWRLLVPGNRNLYAMSVLDRDLFNEEFEGVWRTHLELLSDEDLRESQPEKAFCGLFDRIERVKRVYREELARRKLGSAQAGAGAE